MNVYLPSPGGSPTYNKTINRHPPDGYHHFQDGQLDLEFDSNAAKLAIY